MALYSGQQRKLEERDYFKKLTIRGQKLGLSIIVFTPADVNRQEQRIYGHVYDINRKRWIRMRAPIPHFIFDRCRYQPNARFKQLQSFRARYPHLHYLNRPLANKWHMHNVLSQHGSIRAHLPATRRMNGSADVLAMLGKNSCVYLKPINGTGGRGILRITKHKQRYILQGRDLRRRIVTTQSVTRSKLISRIKAWARNQKLLVQAGVNITLSDGRVHDYRMLLQKGRGGQWEYTGCAGRVGARRSVTSNLHGGGRAVAMANLMKRWFPDDKQAQAIQQEMKRLAFDVVKEVEKRFGQLCEMALDLAVDRQGHVWLLEINPKPSRQVFMKIGEMETYETALQKPLEYALWLMEKN